MTVIFTIIDENGKALRCGACHESMIDIQAQEGETLIVCDDFIDDSVFYYKNGQWVEYPTKPNEYMSFDYQNEVWVDARDSVKIATDLADAKAVAINKLNTVIGTVRAKYITIIPGQESIYQAKEAEAVRYIADATPDLADYPLISAEIGITANTAYEIAQIWLYLSNQWRTIAAALEAIRITAKDSVMNAVDVTGVDAVLAVALDELASY